MRKWFVLAAVLLWQALSTGNGYAAVIINEVLADPSSSSGDANGDGNVSTAQDEFVELANTGADPVSLADWTLSDAISLRHTFGPEAVIPGYGFYVVFGGGTPALASAAVASNGGLSLNNTGDTLSLQDPSSAVVDTFAYGPEGNKDMSLTRSPDATGVFAAHSSASVSGLAFSPGTTTGGLTHWFTPPPPQEPPGVIVPDPSPVPPPFPEPSPQLPPESGAGANPVVPEPASLLLFGTGLAGAVIAKRRRTVV